MKYVFRLQKEVLVFMTMYIPHILQPHFLTHMQTPPASGQVVGGGLGGFDSFNDYSYLSSVELFPLPPSDTCSIPDLPQPRSSPSLSLLSGGRLVVCGGIGDDGHTYFDSCLSWIAGNDSWTPLYTMRCLPMMRMPYLQSSTTVWRDIILLPGRRPLFQTQ